MDLAKNVFANVPSLAIKAIANNTANEALLSTLSSVSVATDFIGSLGAYIFSTTKFIILFIGP